MREITLNITSANQDLLHQEMVAVLGAQFVGISTGRDWIKALVVDDAPLTIDTDIHAIAEAHDPDALTAMQAALLATADADQRAAAIPGWALWDEQQAIDYITDNVTDLASAKVVLVAMARLLVALRDAQWPALGVE